MKFYDVEQNSPEWFELRKGKFTASTFKDLFMNETTLGYQEAIYKVAYERLTNETPESFSNEWMQRGSELEPEAREWYELETYNKVMNGGFFEKTEWIGASPDGLVGNDGIVEIKCPKYTTMINYIINNELPKIYEWQVYGQLFVTERKWCDFIAYHPRLKPLIIRVQRNEEKEKELADKLFVVIKQTQKIIERLK